MGKGGKEQRSTKIHLRWLESKQVLSFPSVQPRRLLAPHWHLVSISWGGSIDSTFLSTCYISGTVLGSVDRAVRKIVSFIKMLLGADRLFTRVRFVCFSLFVVPCEHAKSFQLSKTFCDPVDCSPPGSSVHGISQARILEWVAISFSRGSS